MKLEDKSNNFKSMGIPENMKAASQKAQAAKDAPKRPEGGVNKDHVFVPEESSEEQSPDTPVEGSAKSADEKKAMTGQELLKSLGAKFDENDFSSLLLQGYYETVLEVIPGRLKAKFRTLLTKEYREIDEIVAKEVSEKPMTQDGHSARVSTWNISFGVLELNGKTIAKQDSKGKKSATELAQERIAKFEDMSPPIVNKLIKMHGQITWAVNNIVHDPASENLKNS